MVVIKENHFAFDIQKSAFTFAVQAEPMETVGIKLYDADNKPKVSIGLKFESDFEISIDGCPKNSVPLDFSYLQANKETAWTFVRSRENFLDVYYDSFLAISYECKQFLSDSLTFYYIRFESLDEIAGINIPSKS